VQDRDVSRSIPALVEPSVLRWARESIDLTPLAAARKIGVPDDRVASWEAGESAPSIAQLRVAADVYKRPLAVFFLAEPPADFDTLRDFRRLSDSSEGVWSPALHDDYRRAHAQREAALEIAELDEAEPAVTWRLDPLPATDAGIARAARERLLGAGPLPLPATGDRPHEHLNAWVAALEASGVMVLATAGGRVKVREMRGFSLFFDVLPVITVNGSDSPRGRTFTLLHEYAHLLLQSEGLCDTVTDARAVSPDRRLEARCNAIAAEVLLPAQLVLASPLVRARANDPTSWTYDALRAAAAAFGASAEAFLRRLVTLGQVPDSFYADKRAEFLAAYAADEDRERASGGGNWYRNAARDLGKGFVRTVTDAHRRRVIDSYTAATYLNVKASQLDKLAAAATLTAVT
jgi:Zn-dependent peptidase ImmA (M78 family)/transcriptional regulator with XRE-family HTH domain